MVTDVKVSDNGIWCIAKLLKLSCVAVSFPMSYTLYCTPDVLFCMLFLLRSVNTHLCRV